MKKILITGINSYVGKSFESWMAKYKNEYYITMISLKDDNWREHDFSCYDVLLHVAGIAHVDTGKSSEEEQKLYYKVNTELAIETAKKFKDDNQRIKNCQPKQFILMSSIIVYGEKISFSTQKVITQETEPIPSSFYGDSKLQAELGIRKLEDEIFKIAVIRAPMIYGPNSKGNYPLLSKLALRIPIFPNIKNERSMLFIDNLSAFLKIVVDEQRNGLFFPQNSEYVRTSYMVREIGKVHNKKIYLFPCMNWAVKLLSFIPGRIGKLTNKAFGSLVYEQDNLDASYRVTNFEESILLSERNNSE